MPNNALLHMKYYAMESQLQLINLKYKVQSYKVHITEKLY